MADSGKPDPLVYARCTALLGGTPPHRILSVGGQSGSDILGTHRTGRAAALVETGAREEGAAA